MLRRPGPKGELHDWGSSVTSGTEQVFVKFPPNASGGFESSRSVRRHPDRVYGEAMIERVNGKRKRCVLSINDYKVLCWKKGWRDGPRMVWGQSKGQPYTWSGEAVRI